MWWREVTLQTHAGKHTDTEHYMFLFLFFHFSFFNPHPRMCLLILERKEGKERERNIDVRETSIGCLLYTPQLGIEPATLECALTQNQTHNLLVYGMMLQPTEPPGQSCMLLVLKTLSSLWCQGHLLTSMNQSIHITYVSWYVLVWLSFFKGHSSLDALGTFYFDSSKCLVAMPLYFFRVNPFWPC